MFPFNSLAVFHALNVASNALFFIYLFITSLMGGSLSFKVLFDKILHFEAISKSECEYLLSFSEDSPESDAIIQLADQRIRSSNGNTGRIGVQIGVITGPCYADCAFCSFAYSNDIPNEDYSMDRATLKNYLEAIVSSNAVSSVSLMTIHDFDFDLFLDLVRFARAQLPETISLSINTGDLDFEQCTLLKAAGAEYAYHSLRLGESIDNWLEPCDRVDTMNNVLRSGMKLATGIEPIGAEHTAFELSEAFDFCMNSGASVISASSRVEVPHTRLFGKGMISDRRLLQIRSIFLLCSGGSINSPCCRYGGYYGGLDHRLCEYASSPKDVDEKSELSFGHTIPWALESLKDDHYSFYQGSFGKMSL